MGEHGELTEKEVTREIIKSVAFKLWNGLKIPKTIK
jgi:hypothetical protein